ncbi:Bug family tripartite tricarboxylate transporter substrate binding protein [Bordetella muralis]|uniref:Bug family tripartite tricarboxylate transporter substrate binding protein n=1 Tax=Bordetella muralis TaxID=1649130 RepID=UPI0039EF2A99
MRLKKLISCATALVLMGTAGAAFAQWPDKPVRIVVPYGPGISVDVAGRALAQELTEQLGSPVIVENKPGVSGQIGAAYVARSKPDGYTLLLGASATHVVSPHVLPAPDYDPINDFVPLALVARVPNILVIHPSIPAKTVPEFLTYAKAHPDEMMFASYGQGSNLHLAGELLNLRLGTHMQHIPYNSTALSTDFVAGRIQWMFDNANAAMPLVKAGKLRALAVASEDKLASFGDLPAMSDFLPDFSVNAWALLSAPKGTPSDIVDRLSVEVGKAMQSARMQKVLEEQFLVPGLLTGADAKTFLDSENAKWEKIVKDTGVTVQ